MVKRPLAIAVGLIASTVSPSAPFVSDHDRNVLVAALLTGDAATPVSVALLAQEAHSVDLEAELNALGVSVQFADRRVGYFSIRTRRDRLLEVLARRYVETAALGHLQKSGDFIALSGRHSAAVPSIRLSIPNVATEPLTAHDPYFPLAETGIADFWRSHPTADGRGVNIGFADDGFDLLHPAIQRVRGANGASMAKVLDMVPLTVVDEDNSWVPLGEAQAARADRLNFADTDWRVPAEGRYRGGVFSIKFAPGLWYDPEKKNPIITISVGVLWDPANDRVWVDTDGDRDFTNNRALRDYSIAQEIDWFGHMDGNDADHRIPFGVKIDQARGAVWLSLNGSGHGTWTGSAASANRLTGGLYEAPAPNARLVDFRAHDVAAILSAAARDDVDVINRSGGLGRPVPTGDEDFDHRVVARAAAVYGKPILAASEGLPGSIAISDYWNAQMMYRNAQVQPPYRDGVNGGVLFTEDGTINNLLAPSVTMPAVSRYFPTYYRGTDGRRYLAPSWPLSAAPEGYAIGSNPSCTIAYASGVVASLLSLAKQKGVRYDLPRLTNALFTGAQRLSGFPTSVQGHGLIRVDSAWRQLVAMGKTDDPENPILTRFEVARAAGEGTKATQGYAEEFSLASHEPARRSLWITRRGGGANGRVYRLELEESVGVFELVQSKVTLMRDQAARVGFIVGPKPGHYVTFLRIVDAQANVVMQKVPLQIRVPDPMEEVAPGVTRYRSNIPSHRSQRHSFVIGPGVQAVRTLVQMPWPTGGEQMYFIASRDFSWRILRAARVFDDAPRPAGLDQATRVVEPGLIDLFWENRSRREYESAYDPPAPSGPITAALTLTQFAVAFESAAHDQLRLRNRMADVTGRVEWFTGTTTSHSIDTGAAAHGFAHIPIRIPENTAMLRILVRKKTGTGIASIHAVDATGETPSVVKHSALKSGRAELLVTSPKAGAWQIALWTHEPVDASYEVTIAVLATRAAAAARSYAHASSTTFASPKEATHVAFRIEPAGDDKEGVLIGLKPLNDAQ